MICSIWCYLLLFRCASVLYYSSLRDSVALMDLFLMVKIYRSLKHRWGNHHTLKISSEVWFFSFLLVAFHTIICDAVHVDVSIVLVFLHAYDTYIWTTYSLEWHHFQSADWLGGLCNYLHPTSPQSIHTSITAHQADSSFSKNNIKKIILIRRANMDNVVKFLDDKRKNVAEVI